MVTARLFFPALDEFPLPLLPNTQDGPHYDFRVGMRVCLLEKIQPALMNLDFLDIRWDSHLEMLSGVFF